MKCKESRKLFSAYIDGELSDADRILLDVHLERCPKCRIELEEVRKIADLTSDLPEVQPSWDFDRILQDRLAGGYQTPGYRFIFTRPAVVALSVICALLVLSFGFYIYKVNYRLQYDRNAQVISGGEVMPILSKSPDGDVFMKFVMPGATPIAPRESVTDYVEVRKDKESQDLILPMIKHGNESDYILKRVIMASETDEIGL